MSGTIRETGSQEKLPGQPSRSRLRILYLILHYGHEGDEIILPPDEADIHVCSFFPPKMRPPETFSYLGGDGSVLGFIRALHQAHQISEYDVRHAHTPHVALLLLLYSLITFRGLGNTVFTAHHSFTNVNLKWRNKLIELPIFASFGRIICVSDSARKSFPPLYTFLAGSRLQVVRNTVDLSTVDRAVNQQTTIVTVEDSFTVLSVGRLIPVKNPLTVLRAFARFSSRQDKEQLLFIGEGQLRSQLERELERLRLHGQVTFRGLIPRGDVYRAMAAADVFVSASTGEGLPLTVLQAMATATPVVLSDIPPHREIAAQTGYPDGISLVAEGLEEEYAEAFHRIRRLSKSERRRLGAECRSAVADHSSRGSGLAKLLNLYLDLIKS